MNETSYPQKRMARSHKKGARSYVIGYIISLILTLVSFLLVKIHLLSNHRIPSDQLLIIFVISVALIQLVVQLLFFLHLKDGPRLNLIVFLFMLIVVVILVFGSLWIMHNLNYNHIHILTPEQTNTFIIKDEGIKP
jgi:cytochrome o ubiquinol oxidase operon protein cyoD